MRRAFTALGFFALLTGASLSLTVLPNGETRAAGPSATFTVPASDGYGVAGCLRNGGDCGGIVAKAWCEAHGYVRAESYVSVPAPETTGSVMAVRLSGEAEPAIAITCSN